MGASVVWVGGENCVREGGKNNLSVLFTLGGVSVNLASFPGYTPHFSVRTV